MGKSPGQQLVSEPWFLIYSEFSLMAHPMSTSLAEGQSTNRPSLFTSINFPYWKARMKRYIQAVDYHLWKVIFRVSQISMIRVDGINIPKFEED